MKEIINTFIKAEPLARISHSYYNQYKQTICNHLEGIGLKNKKTHSRVRVSKRFKIYLSFHIKKNRYDLDNLIKSFLDILEGFLGDDDINIWEIRVIKTLQPPVGIKVRVIEYLGKYSL